MNKHDMAIGVSETEYNVSRTANFHSRSYYNDVSVCTILERFSLNIKQCNYIEMRELRENIIICGNISMR